MNDTAHEHEWLGSHFMGYTQHDLDKFKDVLHAVITSETCTKPQAQHLREIISLFHGLEAEGRINA